jgi:hypothetical protein
MSGVMFTIELRGQTVVVTEALEDVSLVDADGNCLDWRLTEEEWDAILETAASHGYDYDFWHYECSEEEDPPESNTP